MMSNIYNENIALTSTNDNMATTQKCFQEGCAALKAFYFIYRMRIYIPAW